MNNAGVLTIEPDAVGTLEIIDANVTDTKLDKANISLTGFANPTADLSMGTFKLTDVVDPTDAQDAATKNYVDTEITNSNQTNTLFPTELAVKTYVDTEITNSNQTIVSADAGNSITASGTDGGAFFDDSTLTTAIAAVQTDVDNNETAANTAIALKEDAANKSTDVTLADATNTLFPTELAVKTYVDNQTIAGGGNNLATDDLVQDAEDRTYDLNGNDLQFAGSGSIGIGNFGSVGAPASIEAKLDVDGVIRARDRFRTSSGSATLPGYGFFTNSDNNMGMFRAGIDLLAFSTNGTEAIRIDAAQNVGIGPTFAGGTTISSRLHIDGDIRAEGIITASGTITENVPDYVFQKYFTGTSSLNNNYRFKSLKEIEDFIKQKNHLPGIKSADEIINQGFWNLGEASKNNLEKIEELFLHTIEQEKKIKSLKSKNEELAEELDSVKKDLAEIKALLKKQ
jgi:hypothetical protein